MRVFTVLRDADDLSYLLDRFLVVVDEIDDLPMFCRKSREALPDGRTLVFLLQGDLRIVRWILDRPCRLFVQFLVRPAPQRERALKRAIDNNQVVTADRPSNRPA